MLRKLTFCIPFDLSDDPDGRVGDRGWQRLEKQLVRWSKEAPLVEVEVLSGGSLLERLARTEHRGLDWFWFGDKTALSPAWCAEELAVAVEAAGDRYHPTFNVGLPVADAVAAVAHPDGLRGQFEALVGDIAHTTAVVLTGDASQEEQAHLQLRSARAEVLTICARPWPDSALGTAVIPAAEKLSSALAALERSITTADSVGSFGRNGFRPAPMDGQNILLHAVKSVRRLQRWLSSDARAAATAGAVLLDGAGGAGKTHLFCDVGGQLIAAGHPVLLMLGQWFDDVDPWKTIAAHLGHPGLNPREVVDALDAAAQAAGRRAVVMIDAINESPDIRMWARHLSALRSRIGSASNVGLAVSCRSSYVRAIEPAGGLAATFRRTHRGFVGHEEEALQRIFEAFGLPVPNIPVWSEEFANPLFVLLYCRTFGEQNAAVHASAVFDAFITKQARRIEIACDLPEALDPVGSAISALADEMAETGSLQIDFARARELIHPHDEPREAWSDSLMARMLSEGLLSRDLRYIPSTGERGEVVRFPYERCSDHLVARRLIDREVDPSDPRAAFVEGSRLAEILTWGRAPLLEAFAVLLPELVGVELPDVALDGDREGYNVWKAFLASVSSRAPSAADGDRLRKLLAKAAERDLAEDAADAVIACAALKTHPLNGDDLHERLMHLPMSERDADWTTLTFGTYEEPSSALARLGRWAERGPFPNHDPGSLQRAAIPLCWLLASPNRFARDGSTKALATMFVGRLDVLRTLIDRFTGCNDPYVTERLAAVALGATVRTPNATLDSAEASRLLAVLVREIDVSRPNVLHRDHIASLARYLSQRDARLEPELLRAALPPYGSSEPVEPRSIETLERAYGKTHSRLQRSLFDWMGDFHKYVMTRPLEHFDTETEGNQGAVCSPKAAGAYVFERVLDIGWTPERFESFDRYVAHRDGGRRSHKPERFGKKYQWIGWHELLGRLSDNYAYVDRWEEGARVYEGAWQLRARDIDPTLPPGRLKVVDDAHVRTPPFAASDDRTWVLPAPEFDEATRQSGDWALRVDDLPPVEEILVRVDGAGVRWVALESYTEHLEQLEGDGNRRDLSISAYSAVADEEHADVLNDWLEGPGEKRSKLPGYDDQYWGSAYLGEFPWGPAWSEADADDDDRIPDGAPPVPLRAITATWAWEDGFDCSLDDPISLTLPASWLVRRFDLERVSDSSAWTADGRVVVRHVHGDDEWGAPSALLAREDWLRQALNAAGQTLIVGIFVARRVFENDHIHPKPLGWIDRAAGGTLTSGEWHTRELRVTFDRRDAS